MKSKKLILDNVALEDEFFEDIQLLGIVCPSEAYQLIWRINEAFNYDFVRNTDYDIHLDEKLFTVFTFQQPERFLEHFIISNRQRTNFLLPEIRNVDFIWMQKGNIVNQPELIKIPNLLAQLKGIVHIFPIDSSTLSKRQYLIL